MARTTILNRSGQMGWKVARHMMPTSRAGACNNHGFTMIELAVVLLIIGIASAVVMNPLSLVAH